MAVKEQSFTLEKVDHYYCGRFTAMASPCEVLVETGSHKEAARVARIVSDEAWRIEKKFSRYIEDNIVAKIRHAGGKPITVDDETARLIDFAHYLHEASEGAFDITSGILGAHWHFDSSDKLPAATDVAATLELVGWQRAIWNSPQLTLPAGSSIDFGGIGKEYAVDRAAALANKFTGVPLLVNFGGDIFATASPLNAEQWLVGANRASEAEGQDVLALKQGGLATSGDKHRYLLKEGVRYSHILDARTGWPVVSAPAEVTVAAPSCIEAGMLATLASLQGGRCEEFLKLQAVPHWVKR